MEINPKEGKNGSFTFSGQFKIFMLGEFIIMIDELLGAFLIRLWKKINDECSAIEWDNPICNNMDGPEDYHSRWSKPEKDMTWLFMVQMNLKFYKTDSDWQQTLGGGKG